jgi:hypothetical protein
MKILFVLLMIAIIVFNILIAVAYGVRITLEKNAKKFPHVANFQPSLQPAKYGDIMLIGTEEHPCEEPPCVDMWNGKTWVKLVPE